MAGVVFVGQVQVRDAPAAGPDRGAEKGTDRRCTRKTPRGVVHADGVAVLEEVLEFMQSVRDPVDAVGVHALQSHADHLVGPAQVITRNHGGPGRPGQVARGSDQLPQHLGRIALIGDQHDRAQQRADPALGALHLMCGGQQALHRLVEFEAGGIREVQSPRVRHSGGPGRRVRPVRFSLGSRHDTCSRAGAINYRSTPEQTPATAGSLAGGEETAAVHDHEPDPHDLFVGFRTPVSVDSEAGDAVNLLGVVDAANVAGDRDALRDVAPRVRPVRLEDDDIAVPQAVQMPVNVSTNDHGVVAEQTVDRNDDGQCLIGEDQAPITTRAEQCQTLCAVEFGRTVHPHRFKSGL